VLALKKLKPGRNNMDFFSLVKKRHSVRNFSDKQVDKNLIEKNFKQISILPIGYAR